MKDFDNWNNLKKQIEIENVKVGYKNRDIFYIKMGQNIGFEQNGKGKDYIRPIIVIKGFNKDIFFRCSFINKNKRGKILFSI